MAHYSTETFTKKLLRESEIEAVLQRLDRLTQDEARMTVAQTLGVIHGLVGTIKVVMEGADACMVVRGYFPEHLLSQMARCQRIVFDMIWVCGPCEIGITRADLGP
jgi:hypothetical protein